MVACQPPASNRRVAIGTGLFHWGGRGYGEPGQWASEARVRSTCWCGACGNSCLPLVSSWVQTHTKWWQLSGGSKSQKSKKQHHHFGVIHNLLELQNGPQGAIVTNSNSSCRTRTQSKWLSQIYLQQTVRGAVARTPHCCFMNRSSVRWFLESHLVTMCVYILYIYIYLYVYNCAYSL